MLVVCVKPSGFRLNLDVQTARLAVAGFCVFLISSCNLAKSLKEGIEQRIKETRESSFNKANRL